MDPIEEKLQKEKEESDRILAPFRAMSAAELQSRLSAIAKEQEVLTDERNLIHHALLEKKEGG